MNSKKQEQQAAAGFNVSYDSSYSAIKNNIFNFKGGVPEQPRRQQVSSNEQRNTRVGSEEVPNKPTADKLIMRAVQNQLQTSMGGGEDSKMITSFNQT